MSDAEAMRLLNLLALYVESYLPDETTIGELAADLAQSLDSDDRRAEAEALVARVQGLTA